MGAHHAAGDGGDRRNEQDATELSLDHAGQHLLGQQKRRRQIDGQRGVPRREIDVLPTLYVCGSCIGDEQVDLAEFVVGVCDERGRCLRIGHVRRDCGDAPAQLASIFGDGLGVVGVSAVGQAQVRSLIGKSACDGLADATGRPGEQRDAALQVIRHGLTRILIGLPSWRSSFSMPTLTSSRETMSLIERDRSSRPRDNNVARVSMSTFW